jgi:hypothetical protein
MSVNRPTRRRRVLKAVEVVALNVVFWILIPYYAGVLLSSYAPSSPLTIPAFVYEFGLLITVLEVGAALTEGMAVSVPFVSTVSLVSALYLWLALEGGKIAVTAAGIGIVLGFQPLLYLIIVPSLWGAARAPLSYLVRRRAAAKDRASVPA